MKKLLNVYFYGRLTGRLIEDEGRMKFVYHPDWLASVDARPLSTSLPLRSELFRIKECRPFFARLLPDSDARERIAKNLGTSERNDFSLLEKLGGECAGAISFLPPGVRPLQEGGEMNSTDYRELSDSELGDILKILPKRPLMVGEKGLRISLAGAQNKIAVMLADGKLYLPLNGAPSSHIIKPEISHFEGIVQNRPLSKLAK